MCMICLGSLRIARFFELPLRKPTGPSMAENRRESKCERAKRAEEPGANVDLRAAAAAALTEIFRDAWAVAEDEIVAVEVLAAAPFVSSLRRRTLAFFWLIGCSSAGAC
ncbi:unnamed protein product [Caenorhabditis sp. 36 PRJEB53466]|nr:unnamed protein product [Caenorhabditis sp. 36 PRJEB53466]